MIVAVHSNVSNVYKRPRAMSQGRQHASQPFQLQTVMSELYHSRDLLDFSSPGGPLAETDD